MPKLPLDSIRIADLTEVWAGPFATQILADWGAEVIWVESRHRPSISRGYPSAIIGGGSKGRLLTARPNREPGSRPWNRYPMANTHGRNKLSMTIDLSRPSGIDVFKRLVQVSDIVIENRGPGTMEKLGITYEILKEIKPDLIMVSMPGFGLSGPYMHYRSWGTQLDPFVGQSFLMGYRDSDTTQYSGTVYADATAGAIAALAVLMSLHYRSNTKEGQYIEVAQVESLIPQFGESIMEWTMNGLVQANLGNRNTSAIQGCYRCKGEDRWVNITIASDEEWEGFCMALGNPNWSKDKRFGNVISRYRHHDELDNYIEEWTVQHDSREIMLLLQKEGVAAGPVMDERDCHSDIHLRERKFFQKLTHVDCGTHYYPGIPWKMSKMPNRIRRPAPTLGEHNEYIYRKVIGVSEQEYNDLEKEGHIGSDYDIYTI